MKRIGMPLGSALAVIIGLLFFGETGLAGPIEGGPQPNGNALGCTPDADGNFFTADAWTGFYKPIDKGTYNEHHFLFPSASFTVLADLWAVVCVVIQDIEEFVEEMRLAAESCLGRSPDNAPAAVECFAASVQRYVDEHT